MPHAIPLVATPAALPMLLVAIAIFALGLFVLARERASEVTLSFLFLTITVATWLFAVSAMIAVTIPAAAFAFARLSYVGIVLIPAAVLHFTIALLGNTRRWRALVAVNWSCSLVFLLLFTRTRLLLPGTWHYSWGFYPRLAPWSATFLTYFGLALGTSLFLLATTPARSAQERRRSVSFLFALAVGYLGCIDYVPAFGIGIFPYGFIAILGFAALSARSILRFRLADLSPSFVADRLLQTMHGGVIVVDTAGIIRLTNQVAAQLLGWPLEEMVDTDLRKLLDVSILPVTDSDSFCRRSFARNRVVTWRRRDCTEVEISLSASALRDERGDAVGILYALSDISDRKRAEANEYGATHDLLTRLPNRARFATIFNDQRQRILAGGRTPAVLFVDLDGFKSVNDGYGHNVGDALLQLVATRLRNSIRGTDVIARYGGDEFVLLLDLAVPADVDLVARKLIGIASADYTVDALRVTVGASVGAAFYPTHGRTAEELVRAADAAMYAAKRAGKGRLEVAATPPQPTAPKRDDRPAPPPFNVDARA